LPFHEPVETYSTSPHVYLELDIPESVTGTLPRSERTRAGLDAEEVEDLGGRDAQRSRSRQRPARRTDEPAERPTRNRNRRRTRGGQPVTGSDTDSGATSDVGSDSAGEQPAAEGAGSSSESGSSAPRRRRRRASRGGSGGETRAD
jgi:hypothetical protein